MIGRLISLWSNESRNEHPGFSWKRVRKRGLFVSGVNPCKLMTRPINGKCQRGTDGSRVEEAAVQLEGADRGNFKTLLYRELSAECVSVCTYGAVTHTGSMGKREASLGRKTVVQIITY